MSDLDFSGTNHPSNEAGFQPISLDPTCEVCGVPLPYGGRGRKPKFCEEHKTTKASTGGSTRNSSFTKEVELACANMDTLYQTGLLGLMFVSPNAADVWSRQIEKLNAQNPTLLANNKNLVRKINATGEKGGTLAFAVTHALAVAPVLAVVAADFRAGAAAKAAARDQAARESEQYSFVDEGFADPDAVFNGVA